jgi:soluble P-type ATPase
MLELNIPGRDPMRLEALVIDYNGTIAVDGVPKPGCLERLRQLAETLEVHVLTADTFGVVASHLNEQPFTVKILPSGRQDEAKAAYVRSLGLKKTVSVGNGANDARMLGETALGIAVLQEEGACVAAVHNADVVFGHINEALDALLHPKRLVASLRT